MRKIFLSLIIVLFLAGNSWATWTLTPTLISKAGHYMQWKVVCTSDGNALSATDLVAIMPENMKRLVQGATLMVMTVSPGTGSVAPDTTINITLSNAQGIAVFVHTGYSNTADTTGISLAEDFNQYPTVFGLFYLTISDIGASGDQVTLYFDCWIE